jgi:hypothetical protein
MITNIKKENLFLFLLSVFKIFMIMFVKKRKKIENHYKLHNKIFLVEKI